MRFLVIAILMLNAIASTPCKCNEVDELIVEVAFSQTSILEGDIVFVQVAIRNPTESTVVLDYNTIGEVLDIRFPFSFDARPAVIAARPMGAGHGVFSTDVRIPPNDFRLTIYPIRVIGAWDGRTYLRSLPQALSQPSYADVIVRLPYPKHTIAMNDGAVVTSRIIGERIDLTVTGTILHRDAPNEDLHDTLKKRASKNASDPDRSLKSLIGLVHGAMTANVDTRDTVVELNYSDGILRGMGFPLPASDFELLSAIDERWLNQQSTLARLLRINRQYAAIRQEAESSVDAVTRSIESVKESPAVERAWLVQQILYDLARHQERSSVEFDRLRQTHSLRNFFNFPF